MPIVWLGLGLALMAAFAIGLWMKVGISSAPHGGGVVVRAAASAPPK